LAFDWHQSAGFWCRWGFQGRSEAVLAQRGRGLVDLSRREKTLPLRLKGKRFDRQLHAPNSLCRQKIRARLVEELVRWGMTSSTQALFGRLKPAETLNILQDGGHAVSRAPPDLVNGSE
jgi:hypothetical protein